MRLIDADAFKRYLDDGDECINCPKKAMFCSYKCDLDNVESSAFSRIIDEQPTIDAVPVVHGEWQNRRTWTHDGEWYCTACDKEITIYMGEKRGNDRYKYCPNCGARMDGAE